MVASCNPPTPRNDWLAALMVLVVLCLISQLGCSSPIATTGLIAQGQHGLADARHSQQRTYARYYASHQSQLHALDDAADSPLQLVEAVGGRHVIHRDWSASHQLMPVPLPSLPVL